MISHGFQPLPERLLNAMNVVLPTTDSYVRKSTPTDSDSRLNAAPSTVRRRRIATADNA